MIISCPACESRFKIDPDRVPADGKQVRCGKCAHVWRIAADGGSMPPAADSAPAPEPAEVGRVPGLFGKPRPAESPRDDDGPEQPGEQLAASTSSHPAGTVQNGENGGGEAAETGEADQAGTETGAGNGASPPPPLLGTTITPNARQKLAEARKGRSRVRFLIIALALMIVAVVAVSFITGSDGLDDALRNVPGLDDGDTGADVVDEDVVDETPATDSQ